MLPPCLNFNAAARRLPLAGGQLIAALSLAACLSQPAPTASPTGPTATLTSPLTPAAVTATVAPLGAGQPASPTPPPTAELSADIFTIALAQQPGQIDPANATDASALLITRHLYDGLTAYAPGATRVEPALATAWESTAALTWTFTLRTDVLFSDGTPFTAQVAARNFERWNNRLGGEYLYWGLMFGGYANQTDAAGAPLSQLVEAQALDDRTLLISLSQPNAALPATLAMPAFAMVNPNAFASTNFGWPGAPSAGTGAFILKDWQPDDLVQLERNPAYWGQPAAPAELIFKAIPDDTQRLLALQVSEVEGMASVNPQDFAAVQADPNLRLDLDPPLTTLYLGFNQAHTPWNNVNCRLAVVYALNKNRYAQALLGPQAQMAASLMPPGLWGYTTASGDREYDPELAQDYWEKCRAAKVEIPDNVNLYVPPLSRPYLPDPPALGAAIQADLAALGLPISLATPEWNVWRNEVHSGQADLFLLGWTGVNGDPDSFLCPLFCGADAAFNSDGKGQPLAPDADLTALLTAARTATGALEREQLYAQAQARLFESVPAAPLAYLPTGWGYRANVQGNIPSPIEDVFFGLHYAP